METTSGDQHYINAYQHYTNPLFYKMSPFLRTVNHHVYHLFLWAMASIDYHSYVIFSSYKLVTSPLTIYHL